MCCTAHVLHLLPARVFLAVWAVQTGTEESPHYLEQDPITAFGQTIGSWKQWIGTPYKTGWAEDSSLTGESELSGSSVSFKNCFFMSWLTLEVISYLLVLLSYMIINYIVLLNDLYFRNSVFLFLQLQGTNKNTKSGKAVHISSVEIEMRIHNKGNCSIYTVHFLIYIYK